MQVHQRLSGRHRLLAVDRGCACWRQVCLDWKGATCTKHLCGPCLAVRVVCLSSLLLFSTFSHATLCGPSFIASSPFVACCGICSDHLSPCCPAWHPILVPCKWGLRRLLQTLLEVLCTEGLYTEVLWLLLQVELLLFDEAAGGRPQVLPMQRDEHGVWLAQVSVYLCVVPSSR